MLAEADVIIVAVPTRWMRPTPDFTPLIGSSTSVIVT